MRAEGEQTPVGKIVSESTAFASPYYKVVERVVETPNGEIREPQLLQDLQGKKFAAVVVTTSEGKILFVREPKYGQMDYFLVVPTGAVKKGETPSFAAARETLEETGYLAENFRVINSRVVSKPDKLDGGEHVILVAENAQKVQEPEQFREVIELTKQEVEKLLDGEIKNLQLEVDISRLAVLEALRHLETPTKKQSKETKTDEILQSLAEEMRETIQAIGPAIKAVELTTKRNKVWKHFLESNKKRHLLVLAFHALHRLQTKNDYREITLGEMEVPDYDELRSRRFVGQKTASLIKQAFPNNSMFDSQDQTQ